MTDHTDIVERLNAITPDQGWAVVNKETEGIVIWFSKWKTFNAHKEALAFLGEHRHYAETHEVREYMHPCLQHEAAAEITRLRAEAEALRKAHDELRATCATVVWLTLQEATSDDADDKGLDGWMREAERRILDSRLSVDKVERLASATKYEIEAQERERCAKAAERWGLARQPEYGGTALMNFASELRAGKAYAALDATKGTT